MGAFIGLLIIVSLVVLMSVTLYATISSTSTRRYFRSRGLNHEVSNARIKTSLLTPDKKESSILKEIESLQSELAKVLKYHNEYDNDEHYKAAYGMLVQDIEHAIRFSRQELDTHRYKRLEKEVKKLL